MKQSDTQLFMTLVGAVPSLAKKKREKRFVDRRSIDRSIDRSVDRSHEKNSFGISNSLCYAHTAGLPETYGWKSVSMYFSNDGVTQQVPMYVLSDTHLQFRVTASRKT